jgi:hypothetical protein
MAGCASCGGCCASCGGSCGAFGAGLGTLGVLGEGLAPGLDGEDGIHGDSGDDDSGGGIGYFAGVQLHPWFGPSRKKVEDPSTPTVDSRALADPHHPGHREAITAISHIDPEKHSRLMEWLKKELDQARS